MNVSFERTSKLFRADESLRLIAPSCLVADQISGLVDLSAHLRICGNEALVRSAQRRGYVVLQGGARFCSGMPTMRFVSFEQLEESLPLVHLAADGLARVSVRDETGFVCVKIELRMGSQRSLSS